MHWLQCNLLQANAIILFKPGEVGRLVHIQAFLWQDFACLSTNFNYSKIKWTWIQNQEKRTADNVNPSPKTENYLISKPLKMDPKE